MNATTLQEVKQLAHKYQYYIELKFGKNARVVVNSDITEEYVSLPMDGGDLLTRIESACIQLKEKDEASKAS